MVFGDGKIPLDFSSFGSIKLGKGAVGKVGSLLGYAVVGVILLAMVLAYTGYPYLATFLGLVAVIIAVGGAIRLLDFADKNPGVALLEEAELNRYLERQQTAKATDIIDITANPSANTAPSALLETNN